MTAATLSAALQLLAMDGLIDLYELDTAPLFTVNGTVVAGSQIYRWTSGIIEVRAEGTVLSWGGAQTTTTLYLDQVAPLVVGRPYQVAVGTYPDNVMAPVPVASWTVTAGVTVLTLAIPLAAVPDPGMSFCVYGTNAVRFRGNDYLPMPIEVTGFEWAAQGKLPRPKMKVSNLGGLASALVIGYGDLLGAKITRIRTLREFLDDGSNPDPTSFTEADVFYVDRKSGMNKSYVEFELAAGLDQQGLKVPRRIMTRDTCTLTYRQYVTDQHGNVGFVAGSCPWASTANVFYDNQNNITLDPRLDVCSLRQSGCTVRFGNDAKLPFSAFPGIGIQ